MAISAKRVFLIVLDSLGIGAMPDSAEYGDLDCNTLKTCYDSGKLQVPNLEQLGLFQIQGVSSNSQVAPIGSYAKMEERSKGKDTTIGHWEIAGVVSPTPLPTYPHGFPPKIIKEFAEQTDRKVLCNQPYSGTKVLEDYGLRHLQTGDWIVYTSADSVFQIAAHEDVIPIAQLYDACRVARNILIGSHGVGRVIARPFVGAPGAFERTVNRHDFSIKPPKQTMLDLLLQNQLDTIGVGKIGDIFAGQGIHTSYRTKGNHDGMERTLWLQNQEFQGLCFINLVDFDMLYGHRNDIEGYTTALNEFDVSLGRFLHSMQTDDILMITADHGCDPGAPGTDHTREYTPFLVYGDSVRAGVDCGVRTGFCDIAATICDLFGLPEPEIAGTSFASQWLK